MALRIIFFFFPAPFRTLPFPGFPHWMNLDFGLWSMIIFHRVWHSQKDSFILPLCLSFLLSLIHVYTETIFSLRCWSLTNIGSINFQQRTSIQYILLHMSGHYQHILLWVVFIAQKLFYTPPKSNRNHDFHVEIITWNHDLSCFLGSVKQCKSLCVQ